MQATFLTFIVVATVIGVGTGHQRPSTATALVVAGLLSVIIYPPIALQLLKSAADSQAPRLPALALALLSPPAVRSHRKDRGPNASDAGRLRRVPARARFMTSADAWTALDPSVSGPHGQ
jgi:hypothetical protein